jgi:hypothetical protein
MDAMNFMVGILNALAWPVAAVVIVFAFRKEFRALVPLIRKLKAGPLEAEFERDVQLISEESPAAAEVDHDPRREMLEDLSRVHPRSAILEAWLGVESAVRRAALQKIGGSPPPDVSSPLRAMRQLAQSEIVDPDDIALFHDLRGLRNQAAHLQDFYPSRNAALHYVILARGLERRLEALAALE